MTASALIARGGLRSAMPAVRLRSSQLGARSALNQQGDEIAYGAFCETGMSGPDGRGHPIRRKVRVLAGQTPFDVCK